MTPILVVAKASVAHLATLGLAASFLCTGCNETTPSEQNQQVIEKPAVDTTVSSEGSASQPANQPDSNATQRPKPVSYNVKEWNTENVTPFELSDLDAMKDVFGEVVTTDENSLDYASNTATKYRFMNGEDPYLDIIDSQSYLEFGWYYANPNDSEEEKSASMDHAKKAYKAAFGLMGEEGAKLVESMLIGQIVKSKQVGGQQVELAKCEFYSCMLIIKKPD